MTSYYNRSEILSFYDLNDTQRNEVLDCLTLEQANEDSYVIINEGSEGEIKTAIPLSMFMRTNNNKFTHGIHSTSAFSGYFITLCRSNDEATVAYKYF